MKCPVCQVEMEKGTARVHGTVVGFILFGFSYQHLWFEHSSGNEERILASNEQCPGYRCPECLAVFIPGEADWEDFKAGYCRLD